MYRKPAAKAEPKEKPAPAGGNALVTFDAQLAKQQEKKEIEKHQAPKETVVYTGPKIKWEETGMYKAMVKSNEIEDELTKIRNLIRKRTDPSYEPGDDDFNVAPCRKFNLKVDYYKLLEVDDLASAKDIKGAYKKLALMYHPDKNRDKKADELAKMQEDFEAVQEAYEILSDRATRRQYDRQRFDEARAKSQGMNSSMYSQGANTESPWGRFNENDTEKKKRKAARMNLDPEALKEVLSGKKPPKAPDLTYEVKISLDKALRGGLKIRQLERERLQQSFGSATMTGKTYHIQVLPGQADGSEYRLEGEGSWPGLHYTPGDLVFHFRHKPHAYLKQVKSEVDEGNIELAMPLVAKAKASDRVVAAWSPTFKGSVVLVRFTNPLLLLAPCKAASVQFRVDREGFPVIGDATKDRGALLVTVNVQLKGDTLVPSFNVSICKDTLMRKHTRNYNHTRHLRVDMAANWSRSASIRKYYAQVAKEKGSHGRKMDFAAVLTIWEAPAETDPIIFAKAAAAMGHYAKLNPSGYAWCYYGGFAQRKIGDGSDYMSLSDDQLFNDDEDKVLESLTAKGGDGLDLDALEEKETALKPKRVPRKRLEAEDFMLKFNMAPLEGFPDPGSTDEDSPSKDRPMAVPKQGWQPRTVKAETAGLDLHVKLTEAEQEGPEEKELTQLIREKTKEMDFLKRKWTNRKTRLTTERDEEEGTLRELLEKDKQREYDRIEREMNGLRSKFEQQLNGEQKWMEEFLRASPFQNEWVCVFKPSMVARQKPVEQAPVAKTIMFDEVVKASDKPTDDYWLKLENGTWALTWHAKHGQLLRKWFGNNQAKFLEIQKKTDERRRNRNQTFLDYKKKKNEVANWTIPPGPTEEERVEIQDEEGEELRDLLEPILTELKEKKKRLRELRQKRMEAAYQRAEKESGGKSLASGQLPSGFKVAEELNHEEAETTTETAMAPRDPKTPAPAPAAPGEKPEWERTKDEAAKAVKDKDWNTALSLYTKSLEQGGTSIDSLQCATLLSNRSLVHSKLNDWAKSLEDATDATIHELSWPKGWLRRATAELRLNKTGDALKSLKHGLANADKVAGQFLPLVTETESALYFDRDDPKREDQETPASASERIEAFRNQGSEAFEHKTYAMAVFWYTRALYHRAMMEGKIEAIVLSNRAAAFLKLELPNEALADALAAAEKDKDWSKPLVRAAQAALLLNDFKAGYQYFARARRLDQYNNAANDGANECINRMIKWEYPAATRRWAKFSIDRHRQRQGLRIWAVSDVFFDQIGVPEWLKSLSNSYFRNDVIMVAGNIADSLDNLRFGLTVLKSKFHRVFFVPGNHDVWVRRVTLGSIIKGEKVKNEERIMVDSLSKFLEVLQVCDDLGVETAPAEVAVGVFVVPLFSWYDREFISAALKKENAGELDVNLKVSIDPWVKWPFPGGSDDAWKFFMRMNESALRATLVAKSAFENFASTQAEVFTMTHFLTRPELKIDWTVPGVWDYIGCDGLDEQARMIGTNVHVYGRACCGPVRTQLQGVTYVHNYIGSTEKHRIGMAPHCIYDRGQICPSVQPEQKDGFTFQPLAPVETDLRKQSAARKNGDEDDEKGCLPRFGGG